MAQKTEIVSYLNCLVATHISELHAAIALLKESRDNESKSSAGDKYETGRAMAQIELDKLQQQLQNQQQLQAELTKLQPELQAESAGFGSLINCTSGQYFIAIGLGKIQVAHEDIFAISLASPIGQALKGAKAGDSISFNGNTIHIIDVN